MMDLTALHLTAYIGTPEVYCLTFGQLFGFNSTLATGPSFSKDGEFLLHLNGIQRKIPFDLVCKLVTRTNQFLCALYAWSFYDDYCGKDSLFQVYSQLILEASN